MDRDGVPRSRIARELGVSRNTVAKYADMRDMSPEPPLVRRRARPATDGLSRWIDAILEADLSVPRKQRHTAKRVYDRAVDEMGYEGSYSSIRRYVAAWRGEHAQGPRDGYLELEWAPGTAQVDFGNFRATVAGRTVDLKLLVVTLPHSNARFCAALPCERAEVFCRGLRAVFERIGRAPRLLVLDNATEAGRMAFGKVTESRLFSQLRAHYRCESRYCNPYSGNEKGSVENAVGFLRRNLLVPVPVADSLDELNARLASGCGRINAGARNREGRRTAEALPEDLAGMLALPGTPFDAVRWAHARADKRGYVRVDGNLYCAGPAWHDREPLVGVRARTVEVLADRGRHVATLARSFGEGETVRNPVSLMPALVARPRAFGESTIRRDMPDGLVEAIDRCGKADRRQALRVLGRVAGVAGFGAACEAEERVFAGGRVPDEASCDILACVSSTSRFTKQHPFVSHVSVKILHARASPWHQSFLLLQLPAHERVFDPVRLPVVGDEPAVVDDAVHHRLGHVVVGKDLTPSGEFDVGGENERDPLVAHRHHPEQEPCPVGIGGKVPPLVQDDEVAPVEPPERVLCRPLLIRTPQLAYQLRRRPERDFSALTAGEQPQRYRGMGLSIA